MSTVLAWMREHKALATFLGVVLLLTSIPYIEARLLIGDSWRGILPTFSDELNYARVQNISEGHITGGNGYFLEHSDGPPLVLFGGAWLNAIPLAAGVPYNAALFLNFAFWSAMFAVALYWLLRELHVPPWGAMLGGLFTFIESFQHVWRPVNLQPVYPFYFLFFAALYRLIKDQTRANVVILGISVAVGFYLFAYLWQIAVITLGLLFLYACARRDWKLLKAVTYSSLIGTLGLPAPLYMLYLSHTSAFFWESIGRLGLVQTHLPTSEIVYSGGWIGIVLALLALVYWRAPKLRRDTQFIALSLFVAATGLALWIMQGSNLLTGKWLETGEHVRVLIFPWLIFSGLGIGALLWRERSNLSAGLRLASAAVLLSVALVSVYFSNQTLAPFLRPLTGLWSTMQLYAGPMEWLELNEKDPVAVWVDPHDYLSSILPIHTRHYVLYTYWGMLELVAEGEIRERYLVSQYFDNPNAVTLSTDREMGQYLGRRDMPHLAKTIEREVKVCRMFSFLHKKECGEAPTPRGLMGEQFFKDMEERFAKDVKPNIREYLQKYHVRYMLKDIELNPQYEPKEIGGELVYSDGRYEIYKFPW